VRVDRCFAFVDLCGFTAFADQHGDERVVLVLAEMRTTLRESCARRGVRIVKWMGDGAMLSSTMIDAVAGLVVELDQKMARTAPSLPIRAGLATGPVIMFEGDDYIGHPVNVAARLCAIAEPHELLATVDVAAARPRWIHAEPARSVVVRGLSREVEGRALTLADPGDDPVVDPVCGLTVSRALGVSQDGSPCFCSDACLGSWLEREWTANRRAVEHPGPG
jgi:class 3 adenylate cyclase